MHRAVNVLAVAVTALTVILVAGYVVQEVIRVTELRGQIQLHRETAEHLVRTGQYPQARSEMEQVIQLRMLGETLWTEPTSEELRSLSRFLDTLLAREKAVADARMPKAVDSDIKSLNDIIDTRLAYRFLGSRRCLMCHSALHRVHIETWKAGRMANTYTLERIGEIPEPERDKCLGCHTTGYNPITKQYSEPGVTCEACHGPGERFAHLMATGRAAEGKVIAIGNIWNGNPCARCHSPKRVPHPRKAY